MTTARLRQYAQAVVDAITNDDVGQMVAGQFMGGNGGLISRDTIKKTDALRRELLELSKAEAETKET